MDREAESPELAPVRRPSEMSTKSLLWAAASGFEQFADNPLYDGTLMAEMAKACRARGDRLEDKLAALIAAGTVPVKHPQQARDRVIALATIKDIDAPESGDATSRSSRP